MPCCVPFVRKRFLPLVTTKSTKKRIITCIASLLLWVLYLTLHLNSSLTLGLTREEERTFIGHKGRVKLKASLEKKFFKVGEKIQLNVNVENDSHKKIDSIAVYLVRYDTIVQIVPTDKGIDRKARTKTTKVVRRDYFGPTGQFPMVVHTIFSHDRHL
jgi:hypothetical protein